MKPPNFQPNDRFKCISPEDMQIDGKYTFTINPEQQFTSKNNDMRERVNKFTTYLSTNLNRILYKTAIFVVHLEVSKNGRLHVHGMLKVKNILKFFIECIPQLQDIGSYEIDTIKELSIWSMYCVKQDPLWKSVGINPILKTRIVTPGFSFGTVVASGELDESGEESSGDSSISGEQPCT